MSAYFYSFKQRVTNEVMQSPFLFLIIHRRDDIESFKMSTAKEREREEKVKELDFTRTFTMSISNEAYKRINRKKKKPNCCRVNRVLESDATEISIRRIKRNHNGL